MAILKKTRNVEFLFDETNVENFEIPSLVDSHKHTAIIVCTSGSTGLPKGVCLSHAALLATSSKTGLTPNDVMLNFSSLYWLTGWGTLLMTTLQSATRIITTEAFTSAIWLNTVQQHKVTVTLTPPYYLTMILQDSKLDSADISSLKMYLCTGSMVPHDLCDRMNKRLTNGVVLVAYAMSETAGVISINISSLRPGSVGQLLPGFNAKIIDESGRNCGIDEDGEIYFQSNYKFLGYYGDMENTKKTMDEDGWLRTGDVGHFDSEGFLYLIDRQKEILKYLNYQVSPSEIENVLIQLPGIANICVVGISDNLAGDLPAAVIMKSTKADISENEINALMKDKFSDFKQLRGGIYFVESLPTTPSGKILRRKVKEIAMQQYSRRN